MADRRRLTARQLVELYESPAMGSYPTAAAARRAAARSSAARPGFASQLADDVGTITRDTPLGLYALGKAQTLDTRDYWRSTQAKNRAKGTTPSFPRTRALGGGLVHSLVEDFRHPLRHPGYTLLDLAIGAGTAAKLPAEAGRAAAAARAFEPRYLLKAPPRHPALAPRPSFARSLAKTHVDVARAVVPKPTSLYKDAVLVRSGSARERTLRGRETTSLAATLAKPQRRSGR